MKPIKVILLSLFTIVVVNANAQVFVSGSIGMSSSGGSVTNGNTTRDKNTNNSFNFSPSVGTFLLEEWAIGLGLLIGSSKTYNPNNDVTTTSSSFGISPFARYYFFNVNRFSAFGQGTLGISSGSSKWKSNNVTVDGPKTSTFSINVAPGIAYNLSERFALETSINLFSFGFSHQTEKDGDRRDKTSNFHLGAGLNNIANTGNIRIGAIWKF
jgi:hypothetical protein